MSRRILIDRGEEALNRIQRTKVTLEDLVVQDVSKPGQYLLAVIGKARILNLAFQKSVFARVTFNNWASYKDYSGAYTESSEDGSSDIFAFGFIRRDRRPVSVEFALSCVQNGKQYWDNNSRKNYCFHLRQNPLKDPEPIVEVEPDIVTTWRAAEESSGEKGEEIIFDTSSYPHFQAHPLTPTKLRYYSSLKNAPEKEVTPTKVKDAKHVHAFNALAIESLLIEETTPPTAQVEQIESVSANQEECEVSQTIIETTDGERDIQEDDAVSNPIEQEPSVAEESVEPVKIIKPDHLSTHDDIFDKFEREKEGIAVDLQIIEEPASSASNDDLRDAMKPQLPEDDKDFDHNATQLAANSGSSKGHRPEEQQDKEYKKENAEKEAKSSEKEISAEREPDKKQTPEGQLENGDDQSLSSRKEKIENAGTKKKHKKGFLSRFAWCGKSEPD